MSDQKLKSRSAAVELSVGWLILELHAFASFAGIWSLDFREAGSPRGQPAWGAGSWVAESRKRKARILPGAQACLRSHNTL